MHFFRLLIDLSKLRETKSKEPKWEKILNRCRISFTISLRKVCFPKKEYAILGSGEKKNKSEMFCDVLFPVMTPVISFFRLINMERAVLVALHP